MAFVRFVDGEYVVAVRLTHKSLNHGRYGASKEFNDVFNVRANATQGYIALNNGLINCPDKWVGKRVKLVLKVVEE